MAKPDIDKSPLSREEALRLLSSPDWQGAAGLYLSFLMIPIADRFGQWRYAGSAANLREAFQRLTQLARDVCKTDDEFAMALVADEDLVFSAEEDAEYGYSLRELEARYPRLGPYDIVILGEGPAPMDHQALCIVQIGDPAHPYLDGPIENHMPKSWSDDSKFDDDMDDETYVLDKS